MKRHCVLALLVLAVSASYAQEKTVTAKPDTFRQSFTAKFAPAGLAIGKITFGGELNFKHKQSVTLLVGLPFNKTRSVDFDNKTNELSSKATSVMAGWRYYLGKKDMSGFYIEPYLKYVKLQAQGFLNDDVNGQPARFDSHFDYSGFGAGFQLGVQFLIAKKVSLDFFLIGPEANSIKLTGTAKDVYDNIPWTLADSQDAEKNIKEALEDIPIIGNKTVVTVDTNNKTVTASYKGFAPGFRIGGSIGIRF
jgi:hypothetical protein